MKVNCDIKYNNYKSRYAALKIAKDVVFITGKAASGKSTIAKIFEKTGYRLVSLDDIVKNIIIPEINDDIQKELNGEIWKIFKLYRNGEFGDIIDNARSLLVKNVKSIITDEQKHNGKVVVEGSLSNYAVIRQIFGNDDKFTLFFVKPKNEESYVDRLKCRFIEDPDNYGRLGFLKGTDKDNIALMDYRKNGINGSIIKELIETVGNAEYKRVDEWYDHYKQQFDVKIYIN